jgi:hypothetical protein
MAKASDLTAEERDALAARLEDTVTFEINDSTEQRRRSLLSLTNLAINGSAQTRKVTAFITTQLGEPTEPGHWNCRKADLIQVAGPWICENEVPWYAFLRPIPENGVQVLTVDWNETCSEEDKTKLLAVIGYAVTQRINLLTPLLTFETYSVEKWRTERPNEIQLGGLMLGGTYTAHSFVAAREDQDWNLMMEHVWDEKIKELELDQAVNQLDTRPWQGQEVETPSIPMPTASATGPATDPAALMAQLRKRTTGRP